MCGIIALINNNLNLDTNDFLKSIEHRGRHNSNKFEFRNHLLGHTLLKTSDTDTQRSQQPMISPDTGNIIIFNGEVFNYKELKNQFLRSKKFKSTTDTEVLLYLYDLFGIDFIKKLNGDFAIVIFDKKLNKFFIARDRFGVKPIFYTILNGTFVLSSEIRSIRKFIKPIKEFRLSKKMSVNFLNLNYMPNSRLSFFEDIAPIEPGIILTISHKGEIEDKKIFWESDLIEQKFDNKKSIEEILEHSINLRTDCIYDEYSLLLSGGLDSSTLFHYLANKNNKNLTTYSFIDEEYPRENQNLNFYLDKYKKSNIKNHIFSPSDIDYELLINQYTNISDTPLPDPSFLISLFFADKIKQNSNNVVFKGDGGDETFCGHQKHIFAYLSEILKSGNLLKYFKNLNKFNNSYDRGSFFYFIRSLYESLPIGLKNRIKKFQLHRDINFLNNAENLNIPFYQKLHDDSFFNIYFNFIYNWVFPYISDIEDKIFSYYNLVYRAPFTDFELVKHIFRTPSDQIFSIGTKSILKNNSAINYPEKIRLDGQKRSYPGGLHQLMFNSKDFILEQISSKSHKIDFLDPNIFIKSSHELYENKEYGKLFRRFSLVNWYINSKI